MDIEPTGLFTFAVEDVTLTRARLLTAIIGEATGLSDDNLTLLRDYVAQWREFQDKRPDGPWTIN